MRVALGLAPDNRFLLRSAARLYVHAEEPEEDMMELIASDTNIAGVAYEASTEAEEEMQVEGAEGAAESAPPAGDEE